MVIFHSCVSLPEGILYICPCMFHPNKNKAPQPRLSAFHLFTYKDLKDAERKGQHSLGSVQRTESDTAQKGVHANLIRKLSNKKILYASPQDFFPGFCNPIWRPPAPALAFTMEELVGHQVTQSGPIQFLGKHQLNAQRVLLDMDTSNIAKSPQTCYWSK